MDNSKIQIDFDYRKNNKIKIIALTGKIGCGLSDIKDFLISNYNVSPITRIEAIDTNSFLNKIIKGQIIEASCDENDIVWGTDISTCLTCCLYVGIYTPEQIANIRDSGVVEILPIVIDMPAEARLLHLLGTDDNPNSIEKLNNADVINICKEFLNSEKEYDNIKEYLNTNNSFWYYFDDHADLNIQLKYASFLLAIRDFNNIKNYITNLDNFI